jgi:hypothetical protein
MKVKPVARDLMLVFASCILAAGTLYLVSCLNYLPYSPVRDWITDALAMPGGIVGWVFYPGGVHGGHALRWLNIVFIANELFYASVWFIVLALWRRRAARLGMSDDSGSRIPGH